MSDDKIKVSWDDIQQQPPQQPAPVPSAPPAQPHHPGRWLALGLGLAALVLLLVLALLHSAPPPHQVTVDEFLHANRQELDSELQRSDNPIRKQIEDAHVTVTVTSAQVTGADATTRDGSHLAGGAEGHNIATVHFKILFYWNGVIQQGGHSVLEIDVDWQAQKVVKSEITETDAMINTQDPSFWFNVGSAIGLMLF